MNLSIFNKLHYLNNSGTPSANDDCSRWRSGYKDSLHFISGNPTVDITKGILHLYKEKYDN